ncbi:MAG: HIT domain-containing protein [Patescibacteria group bacterium]
MKRDYSKFLIKEFRHWSVYAHENQGYLGRCVIWCTRKNALDLTHATEDEWKELFAILKTLRRAVLACFNPDWFNYAFLGNETRHLHAHLVPRYAQPKKFMGITFTDACYGHLYKTNRDFVTSEALLQEVTMRLKKALG